MRWRSEIENYSVARKFPLAAIFTDGESAACIVDRAGEESAPPDGDQFAAMLAFIRGRADHDGHRVGVLLVPTMEHLALERDGTHEVRRHLLDLHYALQIIEVVAADLTPGIDQARPSCVSHGPAVSDPPPPQDRWIAEYPSARQSAPSRPVSANTGKNSCHLPGVDVAGTPSRRSRGHP